MSWKKGKGYEKAYSASIEELAEMKKAQCVRLGREWSDPECQAPKQPCPHCGKAVSVKTRHKERRVLTGLGEVTYRRHYYWCPVCRKGFFPKDEELGFDEENLSGDRGFVGLGSSDGRYLSCHVEADWCAITAYR